MLVMTLPWHWLGLNGQRRRVAHFDYADPAIAWWGPWVVVSLVGGVLLVASAFPVRPEFGAAARKGVPVGEQRTWRMPRCFTRWRAFRPH